MYSLFRSSSNLAYMSELQEHIKQYKDATADKRRTYGELLAKDKKGVAELSSNNTKLTRLQEEITDFKKKVNEGGADIGPEMDQLRKERESLTGGFVVLIFT